MGKNITFGEANGQQSAGSSALVMLRRNIRQESGGNERTLESVEMNDMFNHSHRTVGCLKWINPQSLNEAPHNQFIVLIKHQKAAVYQMTGLFKTHRTVLGTWTLFSSGEHTDQRCCKIKRGHICNVVLEHREDNIGQRQGVLEALPVPQEDFSETTEYTCHKAHNRKSLSSNT